MASHPPPDRPLRARAEGLRFSNDTEPGLGRLGRPGRFRYVAIDGRAVRDARTLERIRALAIPPAWTDVWINPDPRGHLQATGRDARGRKQPRYHARWRALRDEVKFDRLRGFGRALPALRRGVARDLAGPPHPTHRRVVATVVRLLDQTLVRVGNEEYARENASYGLTTLRDRHVRRARRGIVLSFAGKGGKSHEVRVEDPRLARLVVRCQHLPGQRLFQYVDDDGGVHPVGSDDVNRYLQRVMGDEYTAKDFRTWAGTVLAVATLGATRPPLGGGSRRRLINAAIDTVSEHLRNTRAVCRASYVHPAVVAAAEDGSLWATLARCATGRRCPRGLRRDEALALLFLAARPDRRSAQTARARVSA